MRKICTLIASLLLFSACASTRPMTSLDDGMPAHNPGIERQTASIGIPGFEHLRWGMTESEIMQFYADFGNAYEGRFNSALMIDPMAYRMLRINHYKVGRCDFEVTLRYFNAGAPGPDGVRASIDSLKYLTMHFVGDDFAACRERLKSDLLRLNGPIRC